MKDINSRGLLYRGSGEVSITLSLCKQKTHDCDWCDDGAAVFQTVESDYYDYWFWCIECLKERLESGKLEICN
jgi:hypothetical protein